MTSHAAFAVEVGDQVFLIEGGEEIGAIRQVTPTHIVVYVEGAHDFTVAGPAVKAAHDHKVVLDPAKCEPELLEAARRAHESETD